MFTWALNIINDGVGQLQSWPCKQMVSPHSHFFAMWFCCSSLNQGCVSTTTIRFKNLSFLPKTPSCALVLWNPLSTPSPWHLLVCSLFLQGPINGVMSYVSFWDWLLSLTHPCFGMYKYFVPLYIWVVLHCIDVPPFIYAVTHWKMFGWFPVWGSYE